MLDLGLTFLTGLLASLHCIGMCGPIVLAYSMPGTPAGNGPAGDGGNGGKRPALHAAYNAGRVLSYALLGAVAGLLGTTITGLTSVAEIVAIAGGIVMVVGGLAMMGIVPISSNVAITGAGSGGTLTRLTGSLIRGRSAASKFSLGFLTPLLPCGILYAMLAKAAASGGAAEGALTMAAFGAGMAPALAALGGFTSLFTARMRRYAVMLAGVTIVLMGVTLVLRGLHVPYAGFLPMGGTMGGVEHPGCCTQ